MTPTLATIDDGDMVELVRTANQPGFGRWRSMVAATGGCADPIHLVGQSSTIDAATGEVLHRYDTEDEPNRRLLVACRNRRASRCAPCAEVYRADTYQLIRAGLAGGKSVPDSVAGHPRVFATLTAPSFGAVHHRVVNPDGTVSVAIPAPAATNAIGADDPCLGQAVDPDTYDYTGAVIWNALAGVLWHRTTTLIVRHLARQLGVTERRVSPSGPALLRQGGRVPGPGRGPLPRDRPHWTDRTARTSRPRRPHRREPDRRNRSRRPPGRRHLPGQPATGGARQVRWGEQLDIQPITAADAGDGELTDQKVAGYVSQVCDQGRRNHRHARPASGVLAVQRHRPRPRWHRALQSLPRPGHPPRRRPPPGRQPARPGHDLRLLDPGARPELEQLRLRPWAHMLGFRGHYSTRSRCYSTTLTALRQARRDWRDQRLLARLGYARRGRSPSSRQIRA